MRTTLSSESPLAIDLVSKSILGHWDVSSAVSQCEYQFGQRLIYVQHPKYDSYVPYVEQAQETIEACGMISSMQFALPRNFHVACSLSFGGRMTRVRSQACGSTSIQFTMISTYPTPPT